MKLKELYANNARRCLCAVKNVKEENLTLEMNPLKKIKENMWVLLIIVAAVIGLLLINFSVNSFFVSISLVALLILLFIYGNKATLHCDKDFLNVKQGFQNIKIPYKNLKNVYIGRVSGMLFFLPSFNYNVVVRFEDNFGFLRELSFSLLCSNEKDVEKFINNFDTEENIEDRYVQYEKKKIWKKIASFIFTIIITILVIICVLPMCGINIGSII